MSPEECLQRVREEALGGDPLIRRAAIRHLRELGITLPTFADLARPQTFEVPGLSSLVDPDAADWRNLFRIHWFNAADRRNRCAVPEHLILPEALTGVPAKIIVALGNRFPLIAAHKVLAAYACLAPRLVCGRFHPREHRAVWPSTGNYCRGGIAVSRILGCRGVAVLPENMSQERFRWLERWVQHPDDIVRTPGSESNVKEIYDTCELLERDPQNLILNQFREYGNALAHYSVTGSALAHLVRHVQSSSPHMRLHAFVSSTGSAGTIAAGDYLKEQFNSRTVAVEPVECPTLRCNGFGAHNIQGIGDKHVPFIHNVYNTDDLVNVSDAASDAMFFLATNEIGRRFLVRRLGDAAHLVPSLDNMGLSSWANVLAAIEIAKRDRLGADEAVLTVATDGAALYRSQGKEILEKRFSGTFEESDAAEAFGQFLRGITGAGCIELSRADRERIFNLGYFTWVEQRGVSFSDFEVRRDQTYWKGLRSLVQHWDQQIMEFNAEVSCPS